MVKRSAVFFAALILFLLPTFSFAQSPVWFTLNAPEGSTVTASGPITLRFGQVASTCAAVMSNGPCSGVSVGSPSPEAWTNPQTFTPPSGSSTVSVNVNASSFNGVDPIPGVYKTVQIQEQANPQSVLVNGQPVTVPGTSTSSGGSGSSSSGWFLLNAPEGSVITASGSITLRFGQVASTCAVVAVSSGPCQGASPGAATPETWTSPKTFSPSGSSTVSVTVNSGSFGGVDPLPGVYKTVEVQQQSSALTITVNGQSVTVPSLSGSSTPSSGTWFTLSASEGSVVSASSAITLRFGQLASTCAVVSVSSGPCRGANPGAPTPETWTSPQTFSPSGSSTVSVTVGAAAFGGVDPLPGVYKTVQILEQANPQTITVNGQSVTVPGTSTQTTCQLVANPSAINFQSTTVGYTLASQASIVSNCPSTITVNSIQISGPYTVSGVQTPFSLGSGQSQNYSVTFAPTAAGTANGTITFVSNANSNPSVSLTGTGSGGTAVSHYTTLSWNASTSSVTGYNIYRSTNNGGSYSKINGSLVSSTTYDDRTVASGQTYYYAVTAVSSNGAESGYSNQANVAVPNP